jgi:hypothetical protein
MVDFNGTQVARRTCHLLLLLAVALTTRMSGGDDTRPQQSSAPAAPASLADRPTFDKTVQPFLRQYCVRCHGEEEVGGDLRLDELEVDFVTPRAAGQWIEVMDRLNLGEMPPEGEPRPEIESLTAVTRWIAAELRHAEKLGRGAGGRVLLRRLNRAEYANTIRDLLKMEFLPGESPLEFLPPDGTAEGFDKVSLALTLDPSLLEKYFQTASLIADKAIVDGPPEFPTEVMRYEMEEIARNRAIRYLCAQPGVICRDNDIVLMQGATRSFGVMKYPGTNNEIPVQGMYRIRVRAWGEKAADGEPVVMRVRQSHPQEDQQVLIETEVTDEPQVYEVIVPRDPKCGEYNVSIVNDINFQIVNRPGLQIRQEQEEAGRAKDFARVMRLQSRQQMEALTSGRPNPEAADRSQLRKLIVDWIECEGPLYDQWPPKSHELLLFRGEGAEESSEYVAEIFQRFMTRAFRRPVRDDEVQRIVELVEAERAAGETFRDAVRAGLIAVLCSPKFLYLAEVVDSEEPRKLNDWEIASRLSYFLWSSMPDDELFALVEAGRLRDPGVLTAQVDRMLADEKVDGLVRGFGGQWLRTDEFRAFTPDARLYTEYDEELGEAMVGEALAFFAEVLRTDEPSTAFLDSDWTMLNERLARFYGIEGVEGDHFRRVQLPADSPRGGVLGMAGVAMAWAPTAIAPSRCIAAPISSRFSSTILPTRRLPTSAKSSRTSRGRT